MNRTEQTQESGRGRKSIRLAAGQGRARWQPAVPASLPLYPRSCRLRTPHWFRETASVLPRSSGADLGNLRLRGAEGKEDSLRAHPKEGEQSYARPGSSPLLLGPRALPDMAAKGVEGEHASMQGYGSGRSPPADQPRLEWAGVWEGRWAYGANDESWPVPPCPRLSAALFTLLKWAKPSMEGPAGKPNQPYPLVPPAPAHYP